MRYSARANRLITHAVQTALCGRLCEKHFSKREMMGSNLQLRMALISSTPCAWTLTPWRRRFGATVSNPTMHGWGSRQVQPKSLEELHRSLVQPRSFLHQPNTVAYQHLPSWVWECCVPPVFIATPKRGVLPVRRQHMWAVSHWMLCSSVCDQGSQCIRLLLIGSRLDCCKVRAAAGSFREASFSSSQCIQVTMQS